MKSQLRYSIMKMALLSKFHKVLASIQSGGNKVVVEETMGRVKEIAIGKTNQGFAQMRDEYTNDIRNLLRENNELGVSLSEMRLTTNQLQEKIKYMEDCVDETQQETQMYKSQVESMRDEARKLGGEYLTLTRGAENSKLLIEQLEKERNRLAVELNKFGGTNVNKYQSALAESEIHRKKMITNITNTGQASLNVIYANNHHTKATMTYLKDVNNDLEMTKKTADGQT